LALVEDKAFNRTGRATRLHDPSYAIRIEQECRNFGQGGTLRGGTTLTETGRVDLSGMGPYVDLRNGIISVLTDATIEGWVEWDGNSAWQRIFDFGDAPLAASFSLGGRAAPESQQGCGRNYICLTPRSERKGYVARVSFVTQACCGTDGEAFVETPPFPAGSTEHLAVVGDDTSDQLLLYPMGSSATPAASSCTPRTSATSTAGSATRSTPTILPSADASSSFASIRRR
jgi:hypothetical protein